MPKNKLNNLTNKEWLKFQKSWFIHNPPPRKKGVLVHPAKFPETMAQEFIEFFTKEGETVLDPMAGTGSTLVAALRAGSNSYGIELNPKYAKIAKQIIEDERKTLGEKVEGLTSKVINGDAAKAADFELSTCDYVLTSPPYWDMLRAKGAETQKKRRSSEELDVHSSDDPNDMGNISDYEEFLGKLVRIYEGLKPLLREKAYLTIIVKNVKKGGRIYPLAWDIARELGKTYTLKDEKIWCLPPGQRVWTQSGLKPIENIATNEKVLTHLGTLENVTKTMQHHHSGQLITIKAALLGTAISMTAEHEVLTIERKRYRHRNGKSFQENFPRSEQRGSLWKPAKDLKIGDVVAFPIPQTTIDLVQLDTSFYLPEVVDWIQDDNWYYNEFAHDFAGIPHKFKQMFYPTKDEIEWANKQKRKVGGTIILWSLAGSSIHKTWPYLDNVIAMLMIKHKDVKVVLVGDYLCKMLETGWEKEPRVVCRSGEWSIRETLAFAQVADMVIGPETGVVNSVGMENIPKVITLSHSTKESLTKHWKNTVAIEPKTDCYPCHQMHYNSEFCKIAESGVSAQCQADIQPEEVYGAIDELLRKAA